MYVSILYHTCTCVIHVYVSYMYVYHNALYIVLPEAVDRTLRTRVLHSDYSCLCMYNCYLMYNDSCNAECGLQLWNKVDTFLHACTHGISPVPKTVPIYIQPMHVSQKRVDIWMVLWTSGPTLKNSIFFLLLHCIKNNFLQAWTLGPTF